MMLGLLAALLATVTASYTPASYACDGVTASYNVNFPYLSQNDLIVTSTAAGGGTTSLALTTDYTLSASSTGTTATLTLLSPSTKCPSGSTLKIARVVAYTQPISFRSQTSFQPATHEQAFDRTEMQIQQFSVAPPASYMTAKGDLFVGQAAGVGSTFNVGLNNTVLTADSTQAFGVKWSPLTPGVNLQGSTPGTQQVGHFNVSGTGILGAATIGTLTGYLKGSTGVVSAQAVPIPVTDGGTGATVNTNSTAYVALQSTTPGTQQAGHSNISGTQISGRVQTGGASDQNPAALLSLSCLSNTDCYFGATPAGNNGALLGYFHGNQGSPGYPGVYLRLGGVLTGEAAKVFWGNSNSWSLGILPDGVFRGRNEANSVDFLSVAPGATAPVSFVSPGGVLVTKGAMQLAQGLILDSADAPSIPVASVSPVGSVNPLAAGTYYYKVTCTYPSGESAPSAEVSVTIGAGSGVAVGLSQQTSPPASACTAYGRTTGTEQRLGTFSGYGFSFTDNSTVTPSGAVPSRSYAQDLQAPLNVTLGVAPDGSGGKHKRFGASCVTAATAAATCTTVYSWTTAFADSSYTPICWGVGPTGSPILTLSATQVAASITVQIQAATAAASSFSGVYCFATHD